MSRDKQTEIKEMTIALTESQHEFDKAWKECLHNNAPMPDGENVFYAKYLVEKKCYRKSSEVAMEIFEEIDKFLKSQEALSENRRLKEVGDWIFHDYLPSQLADLKNKYKSEVADDD